MFNTKVTTAKGREQVDLSLVEEVVALAREAVVGLLLDFKDDVSRHDIGHLVTLTAELDLVAILDTLVDVDVKHLALHDGLLAAAALAAVLVADDLTLTVTVWADGLEALDHGTHLAHHALHTGTTTAGTRLDRTLLATAAIAARADDRLLQCQLRDLATVDILQVDLVHMVDGTGLLRACVPHSTTEHATKGTPTAAEELRKEILSAHSTPGTSTLQAFFTQLVIDRTLLRIRQDFVRMGQFLELFRSLGIIGVLVCGVEGQPSAHMQRHFKKQKTDFTYQGDI